MHDPSAGFYTSPECLTLFGASQFSSQPKHRKNDGDNPEEVEKGTGDGKGDAKDHPQDQKENGQSEKFAHGRNLVPIRGRANGKRQRLRSLVGSGPHAGMKPADN